MNPEILGKVYEVLNTFLPILCLVGIFYVMVVLPQRKKAAEQKTLWDHLKKGQTVVTHGGIFGTIESVSEDSIHLRVARDVVMEVEKTSIARLKNAESSESKNP